MPKANLDNWTVSELGCPDCAGVLRFISRKGANRHTVYECYVGHRYSTASLLSAKEGQLESTLWSTLVLMAHVEAACRNLLEEKRHVGGPQRPVQQRIREARAQQQTVRGIIEATRVCALAGP